MAETDGSIRVRVIADTDGVSKEIRNLENSLGEANDHAASLGDKLKSGLSSAAKVGVAAVGAASAGIAALAKSALDGYANYEQLTGGVETLFKESGGLVQEFAANAYKTAGLSANQYMETVTSFSASLLQSLGGDTEAAARLADQAITDMSDNANKMGTDMEMIQNAYNGFAKQNYTMLDNLKLGYGGTKEEMERLLADAQAISGIEYDVSSYADIVNAIHVIQTEMGITGTTAKEASTTIQGSIASMGSAWSNLVTGIADDNADLDLLIGNFVDSVATVGDNILPRLEIILNGIGELVSKLAPTIGAELPKLIAQVLPSLLNAGINLVSGIIQGISSAFPQLVQAGMDVLTTIGDGLISYIPDLIGRIPSVISAIVDFITESLPIMLEQGLNMLHAVTDGILKAIPDMLSALPEIFDTIISFVADSLPEIIDSGIDILLSLVTGIIGAIPQLIAQLPTIITSFVSTLSANLPRINAAGNELMAKLKDGIINAVPALLRAIPGMCVDILRAMMNALAGAVEIGANLIKGVWQGIQNMAAWIEDSIFGFFSNIVSGIRSILGIHSPSKVFAGIGEQLVNGFANGIDATADTAIKAAGAMAEAVTNAGTPQFSLPGRISAISKSLSQAGLQSGLADVRLPAIASGSVLPGNPAFLNAVYASGGFDMESLADAISTGITQKLHIESSGQTAQVKIYLDRKVLGSAMIEEINHRTVQAGRPVLKI